MPPRKKPHQYPGGQKTSGRRETLQTLVRGLGWSMYLDIEVSQVVLVGYGADTGDAGRRSKPLSERRKKKKPKRNVDDNTYGSAIKRSVSLTIRFGRAIVAAGA